RPNRVRASAPQVSDRADRSRRRRAGFPDRAPLRAAPGARRDRRRRDAGSGDDADRRDGWGNGAPGLVEPAHTRCDGDGRADCRFVPPRAAEYDSTGAVDGARGGADADAHAAGWRRSDSGGGTADGRLRRKAARAQERAAAPASGDHDHPQTRVLHARGIADRARQTRSDRPQRRAHAGGAPRGVRAPARVAPLAISQVRIRNNEAPAPSAASPPSNCSRVAPAPIPADTTTAVAGTSESNGTTNDGGAATPANLGD